MKTEVQDGGESACFPIFFRQAGSEKVQIEEVMQEIINVYIDKMKEFEVAVKALLERG